jgi:hypothetical protein
MTTPKDGDFAAYLNQIVQQPYAAKAVSSNSLIDRVQTQDEYESDEEIPEFLLDEQQKLSKELMREATEQEANAVEPLSDEELERQALHAGGADRDPNTPE